MDATDGRDASFLSMTHRHSGTALSPQAKHLVCRERRGR